MKTLKILLFFALLCLCMTSCNEAFLQGLASGMSTLGGGMYGGYGTGIVASPAIYAPPVTSGNFSATSISPVHSPSFPTWNSMPSVPVSTGSIETSTPSSVGSSSTGSSSSGRSFCSSCSNTKICSQCHGSGKRTDNLYGTGQSQTEKCGICGGSGKCPYCK